MSIQPVRPVAVGLPTAGSSAQAVQSTQNHRAQIQARKVKNSEDQNLFNPPGVISRLVRSMRADEYIRMDAVSRGSELANSKGYPADTVMTAVASSLVNGS